MPDPFVPDLDAYCRRIGYDGSRASTLSTLRALHLAHATHVPFENLDIMLGRPIVLDLARLQDKLVTNRRGGYCFEQNLFFDAVLSHLGYRVTRLAARVRVDTERLLPRTHTLLLVEADGARWLCDVGFGAESLLLPVRFDSVGATRQYAWSYRLLPEADAWLLQSRAAGDWRDLYAFTLEAQQPIDYEVANYYVSTHPSSRFTQTLTVQRATPEVRHTLRDFVLESDDGTKVERRTLESVGQRLDVLATVFGLEFPPGTQFIAPGAR